MKPEIQTPLFLTAILAGVVGGPLVNHNPTAEMGFVIILIAIALLLAALGCARRA